MAVTTLEFPGEDVTVGGSNVTVRGTASLGEVVTVTGGNIVLDASFGLGGDTVILPGVASEYSAVIVGSRLVLSGPTTEISIPLSEEGINVQFSNGDTRFVEIDDNGDVVVGDQEIPMGPTATDLDAGGPTALDFTTGADDLQGPAGDDVFGGSLDVGIDGLVGVQTVQGADNADGGDGTDTLNAELNSTGTTQNPELTNIEVYNLTSYGNLFGGAGTSTLNLARSSGAEQLWNRMSSGSLTLNNVGEVAVFGLDQVNGGTTYTVNYNNVGSGITQDVVAMGNGVGSAAGNSTPVNLTVNGAGVLGISQLNLDVSDGNVLNLGGNAASPSNVMLAGSGPLTLTSNTNFSGLFTLEATEYDENLVLDISGSTFVTDVDTGDGNDSITMAAGVFSGVGAPTNVDMGAGSNTLTIDGPLGDPAVSDLVFDNGSVNNVQTLNLQDVTLTGDATLDLTGITDLMTLQLDSFLNAGGENLDISGGPDALTIQGTPLFVGGNLDMNGGDLTVDDTSDLTLQAPGEVEANLYGDSLELVTITGGSANIFSDDITTLESLSVTADGLGTPAPGDGGDALVDLDDLSDVDDEDFASLETVSVTSVDGDSTLEMQGTAGVAFVAGVQEVWEFTITGASSSDTGDIVISSSSLLGGSLTVPYNGSPDFLQSSNANVANDLEAGFDSSSNSLTADAGYFDSTVTVTWDNPGDREDPTAQDFGDDASDDITVTPNVVQQGSDEIAMEPGTGFESLNELNVNAAANASAVLTDVYGDFELMVEAGDTATVDLTNTYVMSINVDATNSDIDLQGDTVGNNMLTDITVVGEATDVELDDDLSSLDLIDVTGVTDDVSIDAEDAGYEVAANAFVEYRVGNTDDGFFIDYDGSLPAGPDEEFIGDEDIRIGMDLDTQEVVTFTSLDFGEARLGLDAGTDQYFTVEGPDYDRIDLSELGYTNAGQLQFEINGDGDLIITDLVGDSGPEMSGTIVIDIVSGSGDFGDGPGDYTIDDFASNNIIFA